MNKRTKKQVGLNPRGTKKSLAQMPVFFWANSHAYTQRATSRFKNLACEKHPRTQLLDPGSDERNVQGTGFDFLFDGHEGNATLPEAAASKPGSVDDSSHAAVPNMSSPEEAIALVAKIEENIASALAATMLRMPSCG